MSKFKKEQEELSLALGHIEDNILSDNGLEKSETGSFLVKAEPEKGSVELKKVVKKEKTKPRISFVENPRNVGEQNLFKRKEKLLPDSFLKDIRVNDSLVADILRVRGNTMSMFGTLRKNKYDEGLEVEVKEEFIEHISSDQMPKINERISQFKKFLINCGNTEGMKQIDRMNLSTFMDLQTKNGLTFGRFATEFRWQDGKVSYFRPTDAATVYRVNKKGELEGPVRDQARMELERMLGEKIDISRYDSDEYAYLQVIDNVKQQAYTDKEMDVFNMYPSTDIEHRGYPVTPLDTVVSSVTTHMNIITYNRLYFQNGRAAKGFMVINSDESNQGMLDDMKRHYNDSVNGVQNSFRTPIIGIGLEDKVSWVPTMSSSGDGEFQFLYDQVARNILSAFAISPSEVSGFGYLDKGTSQQGLSEASNEFKLTAARDGGLRPLIMKMQAWFNDVLFPLLDPELAQLCTISLSGLDAKTQEQESVQLTQDMPLHYNYDNVLHQVSKKLVGDSLGGKFPFNERYQNIINNNQTAGDIIGHFYNDPSAFVDPVLNYRRDPMFMQHLQMLQQANPAAFAAYFATNTEKQKTLQWLVADMLEAEE